MKMLVLLIVSSAAVAQTISVTLDTYSADGWTVPGITFLTGPATTDFTSPFTPADFLNAQSGPAAAVIQSPYGGWVSALGTNLSPLSGRWIGTNPYAGWSDTTFCTSICVTLAGQGNTALYAVSFQIPGAFTDASLTLNWAAADQLGASNPGLYLNGAAICAGQIAATTNQFAQSNVLTCDHIGSLLRAGTNWLYFDDVNTGVGPNEGGNGPAGLMFSATIVTTGGSPPPSINAGGVVNAANYSAPVAPGSIAAVYGSFQLGSPSEALALPLPTNLSGFSMRFGDLQVPLFYGSAGQVNAQIPWELAAIDEVGVITDPQSQLTASIGGQTSAAQTVNLAPFDPGIFSTNAQGTGQGAILDTSYRLVDASNPANPGITYIQIYCTGLGQVTNTPRTGYPALADPLSATPTTPIVTVGGASAPVTFSGLAPGYVGLYQVNAQVPAGVPGGAAVPVTISMEGATSNTVTIAVAQ